MERLGLEPIDRHFQKCFLFPCRIAKSRIDFICFTQDTNLDFRLVSLLIYSYCVLVSVFQYLSFIQALVRAFDIPSFTNYRSTLQGTCFQSPHIQMRKLPCDIVFVLAITHNKPMTGNHARPSAAGGTSCLP